MISGITTISLDMIGSRSRDGIGGEAEVGIRVYQHQNSIFGIYGSAETGECLHTLAGSWTHPLQRAGIIWSSSPTPTAVCCCLSPT